MTDGMKSGAGSDPFADDTNDDNASSEGQKTLIQGTNESSKSKSTSQANTETSSNTVSEDADTKWADKELPYIFERNTVKSDRKMTQYFLQDETQVVEKEAHRDIEKKLGTDVSLIDVREALVLVGAKHLDEVADELRDWGYRLKDD